MACIQISPCFTLPKKLSITNSNGNTFKSLTFSSHLSHTTFSYGNLAMKGVARQMQHSSRSVVCEAGTTKKADSAAKRARQAEKRRVYNKSKKSEMKTRMKKVLELPNEKEIVYATLDKWTAWETEFPLIATAKALRILEKRNQWLRLIQVGKWMLSKGQGLTMGTYDLLLLAFDMDQRVEEAESLWNMIVSMHTRSVSKRLFSRMVSLYDHHNMPNKIIEVLESLDDLQKKTDAKSEEIITVEKLIAEAYSAIDRAVKAGALHRNTGANRKSRLARRKKTVEIHHGWYTPSSAASA